MIKKARVIRRAAASNRHKIPEIRSTIRKYDESIIEFFSLPLPTFPSRSREWNARFRTALAVHALMRAARAAYVMRIDASNKARCKCISPNHDGWIDLVLQPYAHRLRKDIFWIINGIKGRTSAHKAVTFTCSTNGLEISIDIIIKTYFLAWEIGIFSS